MAPWRPIAGLVALAMLGWLEAPPAAQFIASSRLTGFRVTVTGSGTGDGTVTSSDGRINCTITDGVASGTCSYNNYHNRRTITLTATATGSDTFTSWSGSGCSGTGTCVVAMTTDRPVVATFTAGGSTTDLCAGTTCWFVRPNGGAYGTENGTSWTNAYDGFSDIAWASVSCGDIIWVAGGTYTQGLSPNKNCTSSNRLSIRRARADDTGIVAVSGWSSAFDATVVHGNAGSIDFETNYSGILVSGKTSAAGGTCGGAVPAPASPDVTGCGWRLSRTATTEGCAICVNGGSIDNVLEYMDVIGPGEITYSADGRAVDLTPSVGTATNYLFSHMVMRDWESAIYAVSCSAPTFEYLDVSNIAPVNTATLHPNGLITWGCPNGIVRHSTWHNGTNTDIDIGEGVFFEQAGGSTAWQIYGNTFYDITGTRKAIQVSTNVGAIKIFNNTFHTISLGTVRFSDTPLCASGEYRNNLAFGATHVTSQGGCTLTASNNVTCASTACWADAASRDYRIITTVGANLPRDAGTSLGSTYEIDAFGATRGADGTWDAGAFEYR
jgi:hypothetical protein